MALLEIKNLKVSFDTPDGEVCAVGGIDFSVEPGDTLAIVGESGSGKTQAMLAVMGLLEDNGKASGQALFNGHNLLAMKQRELNRYRGREIAMIFQDPMTSLNPYLTIEKQMIEVVMHHQALSRRQAKTHAVEMLRAVRIPDPATRIQQYPHEYSGGMRQRAMIAMGLLTEPKLLIADEPTTALDVTVQSQIMQLVSGVCEQSSMALVLITHDLGVVAGICDRAMVMYAGEVVEQGSVEQLYAQPRHPYTQGLLKSIPRLDCDSGFELHAIPGNPPNLMDLPTGCAFRDRCDQAFDACIEKPLLHEFAEGRTSRCHLEDQE